MCSDKCIYDEWSGRIPTCEMGFLTCNYSTCQQYKASGVTRRTMELVWHSCTDRPPEEAYNPCLYVTDGKEVFPVTWETTLGWRRFEKGGWYIEPGVNSDGYWWADLVQTVNGFAPVQKNK